MSTPGKSLTQSQIVFYYATAFLTGGAILALEILGTKLLAPFVGTSHFVWVAQIETTLVALAAGYYFGGKMAAKSTEGGGLYLSLFVAGVYLYLVGWFCEPFAFSLLDFPLQLSSLLLSILLFFIPLSLMALTAPFLIKLLGARFDGVEKGAGTLYAISTLGSVAGVAWVGYVGLPLLSNLASLYFIACLLIALSGIYYIFWGRSKRTALLIIAVGFISGFAGYVTLIENEKSPFFDAEELYRTNSNFGILQVIRSKSNNPARQTTYLLNDLLTQGDCFSSSYDPASPFPYVIHALMRGYAGSCNDLLCVGLGAGSIPAMFVREGVRVDVVEINPAVIPIAKQYFNCPVERMNVLVGDGRWYLNRTPKKYDAVVLDSFIGESPPSHLFTRQAFSKIQDLLNDGGILCINLVANVGDGREFFCSSVEKTLRSVFQSIKVYSDESGNVFFVASSRELKMQRDPDLQDVAPSVRTRVAMILKSEKYSDSKAGMILQDDFNPVDYYEAENRMELRRRLAKAFRNQRWKSRGLKVRKT